ncbi:MAG: hypothetical protein HY318_14310, partial [Armatimonadetes bacterium]|nr:hypothetical protein [Armatimonadota bacterium]
TANRVVKWKDYVPTHQPTINGWYPYTKNSDLAPIEVVHEDVDLHHDAGEPAFQWNAGTITFKQDVTLSDKEPLNILLANCNTNVPTNIAYTQWGELKVGESLIKLGKGGYVTWGGQMGNVTVFALDGNLILRAWYDGKKLVYNFGYSFPGRQFKADEKFSYQTVVMRWPTGMPLSDRLDARVAAALNLSGDRPSVTVTSGFSHVGLRFFLSLSASNWAFVGRINRAFLGARLPVCVWGGLSSHWTVAAWRKGAPGQLLVPLALRTEESKNELKLPEGVLPLSTAYLSLDIEKEYGDFFIGNLVFCDNPKLWLRVLQRTDGGFDLIAHNPGETSVTTTIKGNPGGPLEGWSQGMELKPGEEKRVRAE